MNGLLGNTMDDHPVWDFGLTGVRSRLGRRESANGGSVIRLCRLNAWTLLEHEPLASRGAPRVPRQGPIWGVQRIPETGAAIPPSITSALAFPPLGIEPSD